MDVHQICQADSASRVSLGDLPVHRLNAREKALCSENPSPFKQWFRIQALDHAVKLLDVAEAQFLIKALKTAQESTTLSKRDELLLTALCAYVNYKEVA